MEELRQTIQDFGDEVKKQNDRISALLEALIHNSESMLDMLSEMNEEFSSMSSERYDD